MTETALGWALIHSLWQGTLLGLLVLSVVAATRDPRIRCGAGVAGVLALFAGFCVTFVIYLPRQQQPPEGMPGVWLGVVASSASGQSAANDSADILALAAPWLSWIWLTGVGVSHLWQLTGLLSVRTLTRRANWPASDVWRTQLKALATRVGVRRTVSLLESALVTTPVVIGHLRPVILVPAGLFSGLPAEHVEAVLLHELAHIGRSDYLINLFQRWIEGLFFYHPAVWWMSAMVRRERENCCDDIAAAHCGGDPYRYAQALAALEQHRVLQPALGASGGSLRRRVERLLRRDPASGLRGFVSSITILAAAAALGVAGWAAQHQPAPEPPGRPAAPHTVEVAQVTAVGPPQDNAVGLPRATTGDDDGAWNQWLHQDAAYIIEPAERLAFGRLQTDQERERFIEQFWARREALAASGGTSVKEEHYRRIAYVNERFAGTVPGWMSDRGRVYIVLGPPAEIESHPSEQNGRPPFELWKYRAIADVRPAQYFTFVDSKNNGDYVLQSPQSPTGLAVANRFVRFVVTDPMGRFVTGLEPQHFEIWDNGAIRRLTYFQPPGGPTAVAVVTSSTMPDLSDIPVRVLTQATSIGDAVRQLQTAGPGRKILVIIKGAADKEERVLPSGILAMTADRSRIRAAIIEAVNQYEGGYLSESGGPPEITVRPPRGLPPLKISGLM